MSDAGERDWEEPVVRRPTALQQVALVVSLAVLVSSGGLCVASAMRGDTRLSSPALVLLVSLMRMVCNMLLHVYIESGVDACGVGAADDECPSTPTTPRAGSLARPEHRINLRYAIPAALYTVSDNCAVMVLAKVDPATFSLIWNCKTAVVAVLMRCVLVRKPFTWSKWVGIGLLLLGPVLVELGAKKGSLNKVSVGETHAPIFWHLVCLMGATVSASSNVYTEWVLKLNANDSIWWQNTQMYGWSTLFNGVALVSQYGVRALLLLADQEYVAANIGGMVLLAMTLQTVQAFLAPAVLKYMDNIADLYAHAGSVLLTAVASWWFFDLHLTAFFLLGLGASVSSMLLYYADRLFALPTSHAPPPPPTRVELLSGGRARTQQLLSPK